MRLGETGRTSLDCVDGQRSPSQDSSIAYNGGGQRPPAPNGGDAAATSCSPRPRRVRDRSSPRATAKSFSCIDGLGRYVSRELNAYDIKLSAPAQPAPTRRGSRTRCSGVKVDITLPAVMLKGLYSNLLNYQSLPAGGVIDQPLKIWVAVQGANTTQGVQTVLVEGRWSAELPRSGRRCRARGDESFPDVELSYTLPDSTWTPTGNGPIAFSVAAPAQIPELTLVGFGHSGDAGAVFPMNPYGSFFVRAETGRYGASIDCLEGTIDFADTSIALSNLGRLSPTVRIPTPVAAGAPPTDVDGARGLRRAATRSCTSRARRSRSSRPWQAPAPAARLGRQAGRRGQRSATVKSSKLRISFSCDRRGLRRHREGGDHRSPPLKSASSRSCDLTKAVKYSVAANGTATVSINLTKDAKALLKKSKKVGVTITVTPASGATFTRKLTLKA